VSANRIPVEAFWDQNDARLLAVECEYAKLGDSKETTEPVVARTEESKGEAFAAIKESEIEDDFRVKKEEF